MGVEDTQLRFAQRLLLANDMDVESPVNLRVGSISNVLNGTVLISIQT